MSNKKSYDVITFQEGYQDFTRFVHLKALWDDANRLATRIIGDKTTMGTRASGRPLHNSLILSLKSKTHKQ